MKKSCAIAGPVNIVRSTHQVIMIMKEKILFVQLAMGAVVLNAKNKGAWMKKHNKLSDQFDNGEINHFTHYDYLAQTIRCGQFTAFREHLTTIENKGLITFHDLLTEREMNFKNIVKEEILKRMEK